MIDRNVEFPNRFQLQKVPGTDDIYDIIPAPGDVASEGSLWNKQNVLPDPVVHRIFDGMSGPPSNPELRDALDRLNYQIGDVLTTRRKDLGDNWALCNGDYIDAYDAPELYRQSRENYPYTTIHDLHTESQMISIVVGNTPYSFVLDQDNSLISVYKWEDTNGTYQRKLFGNIEYTTAINKIQVEVLKDWVFVAGTHDAQYNTQKRCFFAASVTDMQLYPVSYLTEGTYDFPVGIGDVGDGIGTVGPYLSYCKIKSDGTYGVVINIWNCYSNSSGEADTMRFEVLELVDGKWMCMKALSSPLLTLISPNYANIGIRPFYNPYLDRWQMVYTSSAGNKSYTYSLYSVDITNCYDSGAIATSAAVSVWSGSDATSGFSYDDGTAMYLVPSHYDEDDSLYGALKIVSETTTQVQTKNTYVMGCPNYKEKDGYFYVMGTGLIYRYDSFSDFLMNVNPVVISSVSWYTTDSMTPNYFSVRDFCINQGLYDLVVTGDKIATLGYNLPTISETGAFAYIKIKEAGT